ncbi:MAG TPA: HAMP domain-containing sensor histidine kinase [Nocardioides sp.]|jgi:signal transduction histidine kinase|uniref:sensor histidine kinase n=1 Tax=Nocardioides sp. TaxID=35761 RepID=UPI002E35EFE1|nr:HAMP domain-containing sensor histidine kinase [Nocardioides sp.]HEX3931081.1 HAMP domain-containing sensor histidine kinase [Nocardioides sp.]
MTHDQVVIVLNTAAWSGGVGVAGALVLWLGRRASVRWLTLGVATTAVLAVVAGTVATSRAMFLSHHDLGVITLVAAVAGVVALVVALAVGTALARWSRQLRDEARRFGESGAFVAGRSGPAEFTALSEELRNTSEKLAESRERELTLEQSRRELVSWVSHDLRTPLAGLRAMTEALEDGLADDPARYHLQMRSEVDRMVRMVDDLFELSRIHAGVLRISPQAVALGDVVSEALAGADSVAQARGVRLGGYVDEDVLVTADPASLSRVVSNLLMNAIRHTPPDGVVEVRGRAVPDGVELSVTDACGGLKDDELSRVFDVGWQGSAARTPAHDNAAGGAGAGLGLAIVKGIVEAHLGNVAVSNHEPGCRFLVTLPT